MSGSVEVKVCGLTRPGDAECAARLGAAYLGVVFAGGPRLVTPAVARTIVNAVEGRAVVGVFGSQEQGEILRIRDQSGIRGAQLHGPHTTATAEHLRNAGLLVFRVVRLGSAADLELLAEAREASDAVLVEPKVEGVPGGSGVRLGLALAALARARLDGCRMVLAGGLTAQNVGPAVAAVRPDVVDVSSGVEQIPGIKDRDHLARFLEAVVGHHTSS